MARIRILIATDELTAELQLGRGPSQERSQVNQALATAGICAGVDQEAVETFASMLWDPDGQGRACIARGTAAVDGIDGRLEGKLLEPPQPGSLSGEGVIDYRERGVLQPIKNGELIAAVVAPTKGQPGESVTGRVLPAQDGKPFAQKLGSGVQQSGDELFATVEGVVLATDSRIDVVPLYTHKGSVDYSSGNLHSAGSLEITGNIDAGFEATADGDIAVGGTIDGGCEAGGSLEVRQGILGKEQAVRAGHNVHCKHVTSARVVASAKITIGDQALQSSLRARQVHLAEGRASVRGGEVLARDQVTVGSAGSPANIPTLLAVGQLLEERGELARREAQARREGRFASRAAGAGRAGKGVRNAVRANDHAVKEQVRLRRKQREILASATIRVTKTCYAGTKIRFGAMHLDVEADLHDVLFRYDLDSNTILPETQTKKKKARRHP